MTGECVCGQPATTTVLVRWADGDRCYRYCDDCAHDIIASLDGVEVCS